MQAPPAIVNVALPSSSEIIALLGASHYTKPDPTLVPVFRLRAALVQPIPVPIPAPWVGVARTQPVPAPLQQSEGCKVSTSTPAGAKASQPRLLATTQATSRSLPPLSGCDVIVSGVLSPPADPGLQPSHLRVSIIGHAAVLFPLSLLSQRPELIHTFWASRGSMFFVLLSLI